MALILSIDTATEICSVNLSFNGEEVATLNSENNFKHAEIITLQIAALFESSPYSISDLEAVALSEGPGSYTGLRIGTSVAKGICFANDIPLINISTLQAMAYASSLSYPGKYYMPMIDARRNEIYTALFDSNLKEITPVCSLVIENEENLITFSKNKEVVLSGNGLTKLTYLINNENLLAKVDIHYSSQSMINLAFNRFLKREFADLLYFEPLYLKLFDKIIN